MKSPVTGEQMTLEKDNRSIDYRKQTFSIVFHYYKCHTSGQQFTTTALDELNTDQVYDQYRALQLTQAI